MEDNLKKIKKIEDNFLFCFQTKITTSKKMEDNLKKILKKMKDDLNIFFKKIE